MSNGIRVSEHHLLFQLPLNASADVDRLIFFYGLDAFGVVGPNLIQSRRPMLTRQAFYPFVELPKALYLFVPLTRFYQASAEEVRSYLLSRADAYLFAWNRRHLKSRLNARGTVPIYEEEREGRYIHCDAGHTWVHDPFRCNIAEKIEQGPRWSTAEEVSSGRTLLEQHFETYERAIDVLNHRWAIAHDFFERANELEGRSGSFVERCIRWVQKDPHQTHQALESYAEWLLGNTVENYPELRDTAGCGKPFIYEPVQMDRLRILTYREVRQLEDHLPGMAWMAEKEGVERMMEDPRFRRSFVTLISQEEELPHEVVRTDAVYPELPMAYFIAGLNGDRPHAQALGYYQVLEFAARQYRGNKNGGGDEGALKALLQDKQQLPDLVLKKLYEAATPENGDTLGLRRPSGRFDRDGIAERIYQQLRNPVVHAAGGRDKESPSMPPYTLEQFTPKFQQTVQLTRELARHFVDASSTSFGARNTAGPHENLGG